MVLDVILRQATPVTAPSRVVVHYINTLRIQFMVNVWGRGETNLCSETVLLRSEYDEVIRLSVLGKSDIELRRQPTPALQGEL